MSKEMEYYEQSGSLRCSEPEDKPSIESALSEAPSAADEEEGLAEQGDEEKSTGAGA
jgi:hypothetical protein